MKKRVQASSVFFLLFLTLTVSVVSYHSLSSVTAPSVFPIIDGGPSRTAVHPADKDPLAPFRVFSTTITYFSDAKTGDCKRTTTLRLELNQADSVLGPLQRREPEAIEELRFGFYEETTLGEFGLGGRGLNLSGFSYAVALVPNSNRAAVTDTRVSPCGVETAGYHDDSRLVGRFYRVFGGAGIHSFKIVAQKPYSVLSSSSPTLQPQTQDSDSVTFADVPPGVDVQAVLKSIDSEYVSSYSATKDWAQSLSSRVGNEYFKIEPSDILMISIAFVAIFSPWAGTSKTSRHAFFGVIALGETSRLGATLLRYNLYPPQQVVGSIDAVADSCIFLIAPVCLALIIIRRNNVKPPSWTLIVSILLSVVFCVYRGGVLAPASSWVLLGLLYGVLALASALCGRAFGKSALISAYVAAVAIMPLPLLIAMDLTGKTVFSTAERGGVVETMSLPILLPLAVAASLGDRPLAKRRVLLTAVAAALFVALLVADGHQIDPLGYHPTYALIAGSFLVLAIRSTANTVTYTQKEASALRYVAVAVCAFTPPFGDGDPRPAAALGAFIGPLITLLVIVPWRPTVSYLRSMSLSPEEQRLAVHAEIERRVLSESANELRRESPKKIAILEKSARSVIHSYRTTIRMLDRRSESARSALSSNGGHSLVENVLYACRISIIVALPAIILETAIRLDIVFSSVAYTGLSALAISLAYLSATAVRWLALGVIFALLFPLLRGWTPVMKSQTLFILALAPFVPMLLALSIGGFAPYDDSTSLIVLIIPSGAAFVFATTMGFAWERRLAVGGGRYWSDVRDIKRVRALLAPFATVAVAALTAFATTFATATVTQLVQAPSSTPPGATSSTGSSK